MSQTQVDESIVDDPAADALPDIEITDERLIPPDEEDGASRELLRVLEAVHGFTPHQRAAARQTIVRGARLLIEHAAAVHYTEGSERWVGITKRLYVRDGRFPSHGDCSSTATWLLWNALFVDMGMGDVVNGENWQAGYTGTMLQHGRTVPTSAAELGDLAIYGNGAPGKHVAVCLGGGAVCSHGSEAGPFKLRMGYRTDLMCVRRYF